jgi:hypothetical protein
MQGKVGDDETVPETVCSGGRRVLHREELDRMPEEPTKKKWDRAADEQREIRGQTRSC